MNWGRRETLFIAGGNPNTLNDTTSPPYAPGEIGQQAVLNNVRYQLVQVDSGATAATPAGVVAANQVAYWKDRTNYIVTNDSRFARLGQTTNAWRNEVAGIFPGAKTAGALCLIVKGGVGVSVVSDGGGGSIGDTCIAGSSTTAAGVTNVTVGTAPTYLVLGIHAAAVANSVATVDLDMPELP